MDTKFVKGMRLHKALWPGALAVMMWEGAEPIPFGEVYRPEELGFDAVVLDRGAPIPGAVLAGYDSIAASGDMAATLDLAGPGRLPVIYSIEYTIGTRLRIVSLDPTLGPLRKAWSMVWNLWTEMRRRRAFGRAAGIQANGYPAYAAYRGLNPATILYLDGRMDRDMMASPEDMAARRGALLAGRPLRLVHSGRLEPMKGSKDLVKVARMLDARGVDFTLDVFGAGSLEPDLRRATEASGGRIRLHAPVDFSSALVPFLRRQADIFVSCHKQGDPSCSYLEAMSCGLPVIGYGNEMWAAMCDDAEAGWVVPLRDWQAMAAQIAALDRDREQIMRHAEAALFFGTHHDFETEFTRRMLHRAERRWDRRAQAGPGDQRAQG